ncbi:aminotransferase class V-fold PLP-dependent enzyme, partial [bacterium]
MDPSRYFDHAATTPLDARVLEAMMPWLREGFGNPHSLHSFGVAARAAVERAREQVALAVGAEDPSLVTFTSGATEALNTV